MRRQKALDSGKAWFGRGYGYGSLELLGCLGEKTTLPLLQTGLYQHLPRLQFKTHIFKTKTAILDGLEWCNL